MQTLPRRGRWPSRVPAASPDGGCEQQLVMRSGLI